MRHCASPVRCASVAPRAGGDGSGVRRLRILSTPPVAAMNAHPLRRSRRLCALAAAAVALAFSAGAAALTLMHGYADVGSASLWIQTSRPGAVEVAWTAAGGETRTLRLDAAAAEDNVVVARLSGLVPGQEARYRVVADGETREGALRAQAHWSRREDAAELSIALGSCFFLADPDPRWGRSGYGGGFEIFDAIAARRPDFMVWLGDNLYFQYPDFLDPEALAARHRRQRAFPPLAKLLTATSHLATWDDHDYGPNDGDASYTLKGETLSLFRRYWANPSFGLPDVPGVFGYARLGDVDLFLLDDRYYRSAGRLPDGPDKTMLGSRQLEWLKSALARSNAPIKLVANGSQMLNRANRFEGWHQFATERRAFLDFLVAARIDGVIFLTGDRHFGELLRVARPDAPPLYELTSSPLTSSPFTNPDAAERDNPDLVPGTLVTRRQFGMIRVSGPGNDRRIRFSSHDAAGNELWQHEIRARDLAFPRVRADASP